MFIGSSAVMVLQYVCVYIYIFLNTYMYIYKHQVVHLKYVIIICQLHINKLEFLKAYSLYNDFHQ